LSNRYFEEYENFSKNAFFIKINNMKIKIQESEEQKIYVTSDTHFGHNPNWPVPIWESRGFKSVTEHDSIIINSINSVVRPNDILFHLGDFCLNTTIEQFDSYLSRIQCQNIWYLFGNHNNPHEKSIYRKAMGQNRIGPFPIETYPFQYKNMLYIGNRINAILNGQFCVLDHFPIYVWEEMQNGSWMLCGHSHNNCELSRASTTTGKILDVGWDGHKAVWSLKEIHKVMSRKQFVMVDHHRNE